MMYPIPNNPVVSFHLVRIPKTTEEALNYCGQQALDDPGGLFYDYKSNRLIYHYKLQNLDRAAFEELGNVEEIWIETKAFVDL